jgi:adenylate cyclase
MTAPSPHESLPAWRAGPEPDRGRLRPVATDEIAAARVIRSFAFIDLSGFTNFVDRNGDQAALRELSLLRSTIRDVAARHAVRVDKWLGDGAMLVGVEPEPLVSAVVWAAEDHLRRGALPLRAGLASGPVIVCDGDDYVGRAVNLAARLCDLASPGQVLAATSDDLRLPASVVVTGRAAATVKGFSEPIAVQVVRPTHVEVASR